MGVKSGFLIGFGAGYVLGAKAGRQRYEEIRHWWNQFTGSPTVQRAAERTKAVATDASKRGLEVVQTGVEKAGSAVKDRLHKDDLNDPLVEKLESQSGRSGERGPDTAKETFAGRKKT
jgi:hypothetical protein